MEARKGGEGGSTMGWCSAAAMVWAAVLQGAGTGVGGLDWGVLERGGAGTRGGEVNREERGCRGELTATR